MTGSSASSTNVFADALHFRTCAWIPTRFPPRWSKAYQVTEDGGRRQAQPERADHQGPEAAGQGDGGQAGGGRAEDGQVFAAGKLVPVLVGPGPTRTVLFGRRPGTTLESLMERFERTFGLPVAAGCRPGPIAQQVAGTDRSAGRAYDLLRPDAFSPTVPTATGSTPSTPGPPRPRRAPARFLGNECLLWLWHKADHRDGVIGTRQGDVTGVPRPLARARLAPMAQDRQGNSIPRRTAPRARPRGPRPPPSRGGKVPAAGRPDAWHARRQQFELDFNPETFRVRRGPSWPEAEEGQGRPRVAVRGGGWRCCANPQRSRGRASTRRSSTSRCDPEPAWDEAGRRPAHTWDHGRPDRSATRRARAG